MIIEISHFGLNAITTSAIINVLAMLLGSWGLWDQIKLIWKDRSAESVSVIWNIAYMAMFAAFVVYGYSIASGALMIQIIRVILLAVIVISLLKLKGFRQIDWLLLASVGLGLIMMFWSPDKRWFFLIFSLLGGVAAVDQPYRIWINKNAGRVSYRLLAVYNIAAAAWIVYGFAIGDYFVLCMGVLYVVINSLSMTLFHRYPPTR